MGWGCSRDLVESFPSMDKALGSIPNPVLHKLGMMVYQEVKQEEQKLKVILGYISSYDILGYLSREGGGRDRETEWPYQLLKWSLVSQYKHVEL